MDVHPVITRQSGRRRPLNRLPNFARNPGRSPGPRPLVQMIPDQVTCAEHRHFDSVAIPDPERLSGAGFIGIILKDQNRRQAVGLRGNGLVSLQGIR